VEAPGARGANHGDDWRKSANFSSISLQEAQVLFPGAGFKLQNSRKTAILPKIHDWRILSGSSRSPGFGTDGTVGTPDSKKYPVNTLWDTILSRKIN